MRTYSSIFTPEVNPFHKIQFQVASNLVVTSAHISAGFYKAGTILKAFSGSDPIHENPTLGVSIASRTADTPTAILAHDLEIDTDAVVGDILNVGCVVDAVVYLDAFESANGGAVTTLTGLPEVSFYGVKTLK